MLHQATTTQSTTGSSSDKIPVVLTGHALQSLRDSGYSLAAALGEVIDNSLEANAKNIQLLFEEAQAKPGKKHIHKITIIDDGDGMDTNTLQRYLQIGFSTRYMQTNTIGKYGVGAKLAALNYAQKIEVWSRTSGDEPWYYVHFDLEEALQQETQNEVVGIEPPRIEPLPDDISSLLLNNSGTIVIWSKVDRLEEGRQAPDAKALIAEIEQELSRMFRYFLSRGIYIFVNNNSLLPHDPLYLMKGTWADKVLFDHYNQLRKDIENGEDPPYPLPDLSKTHFPAREIARELIEIGDSFCTLTVTLYPKEVARQRGKGNDALAKKIFLPQNEGAISFVRLDREINYTNVPRIFPRGVQNPDRFIGIELSFKPELDPFFGVKNVKRGVEPYDELRTQIRKRLAKYIPEARDILDEIWGESARATSKAEGEHKPILDAAKEVNKSLPKGPRRSPISKEERDRSLNHLAKDVVGNDEGKQQQYLKKIENLPFVLESVDFPGDLLIDIQHINEQIIIRINTRHRFYQEMWEPLNRIFKAPADKISIDEARQVARRSIEALTLLIIAYGKAESMDENPRDRYSELRSYWGKFTDSLMERVKDIV